jgi:DNA polymerase III subunit delta'
MVNAPLLVDAEGALPLPWLAAPLQNALASQRGHALLLHAAPGLGALPFALCLAQSFLCEAQAVGAALALACGRCGSCRLLHSHLHPDLSVLMPETLRRAHSWPLAEDKPDGDDAKRKPSKQVRIDEVRALIDWSQKTSARGQGKVAVIHPADSLNVQSANALLKTLEEPPPGTRLLLTTADPASLLPTVRSRCQSLRLPEPTPDVAAAWLLGQGLGDGNGDGKGDGVGDQASAQARLLMAASSRRPLDALAMLQAGVDAQSWAALPGAVARGQAGVLAGWPVPTVVDALQKICHDAMARATGASARFFPNDKVPARGTLLALADWSRQLQQVAQHAEHPWNEALLIDALVAAGAKALAETPKAGASLLATSLASSPTTSRPAPRGLDTLPR